MKTTSKSRASAASDGPRFPPPSRSAVVTGLLLSLLAAHVVSATARAATGSPVVTSPNHGVQFKLVPSVGGQLSYSVAFRGKPVIELSPLSFAVDGLELTDGVEFGTVEHREIEETYPWRGPHALALNHCSVAVMNLTHKSSKTAFVLEVRAFDDGAAFRWIAPGDDRARVPGEATAFKLPPRATVWSHDLEGHYEATYRKQAVAEVKPGQWVAPPLTFRLPRSAGYASITEAALVNYSGMAFRADGSNGFNIVLAHQHPASYPFRLRYTNDIARLAQPASVSGIITTPWRVVMISRDLNGLVNSDIVHNLCPPPDPALFPAGLKTSWVRPGRAVWKYLDGGESTLEGTKEFCRLAGELGFEYNVVEGYWSRWTDDQIKDLVAFSRQQGVGLWLWKHSRQLRTDEARDEFFQKLESLGVAGAKIDFFDHEHKEIIDLYQALLKTAARHKILVNFHGSNKPTGEARTWPNEMVREAVRGMEASRLQDRATHDVTLPFTRYLAGHGDYTVMHFGARRANTTWTHQIASAAIFDHPLLTYAANPASILANPARDLIKSIPSVWDETIVLPVSEVGEVAAFARRSGDTWFLAVMNGPAARTLKLRLSFLPSGTRQALLVRDHQGQPDDLEIQNTTASRGDSVRLSLEPGGGFIGRYSRP